MNSTSLFIALQDGLDGFLLFADFSLNRETPSLRGCRWSTSSDAATRFDSKDAARAAIDAADAGNGILVLPESGPLPDPIAPKRTPELSRRTNRMRRKTA